MQVHVRTYKVMPGRSDVVRSKAEGTVLELFNTRMAAVSLTGYIFFGSSVSISERVRPCMMQQLQGPKSAEALLLEPDEMQLPCKADQLWGKIRAQLCSDVVMLYLARVL